MASPIKIALPRGVGLSPFEMQNFEPLLGAAELTAYMLSTNAFPVDRVRVPLKILKFPDESIFRPTASLVRKYFTYVRGLRYYMYGLERHLADKQIIHSWEPFYGFSFQSARVKENTGARLVITNWNLIPFGGELTAAERRRAAWVKERTDLFLCVTSGGKDCLIREGIPAQKIQILPMGVDQDRFRPGPKNPTFLAEYGLRADHIVVLFLGRYAKEKGIRSLLEAIDLLRSKTGSDIERLRFLLVGGGPEEQKIRGFVAEKGLSERVRIFGPAAYHEVPDVHRLADIFVIPSVPAADIQEQFGYALVESMASGRAIVASDSGALREIGGDAVLTFPSSDARVLADTLATLIEDDGARHELGAKALSRARDRYDSRKVARRLLEIYEALM